MRFTIFTEATSRTGYGHLIRCSSLYDEIKNRGFDVKIVINGDTKTRELLPSYNLVYSDWLNIDNLKAFLEGTDYSIVDSYLAPIEVYKRISRFSKKSLFIDDYQRLNYPKGIVMNPLIKDESARYRNIQDCKILSGSRYVILRTDFVKSSFETNKRVESCLIIMGATDILDLTPKVAKVVRKLCPQYHLDIIIGSNRDLDLEDKQNITVYSQLNASEVCQLMYKNQFIITAAGQTIFELLYLNRPFLPIQVIENQSSNISSLKEIFKELIYLKVKKNDSFELKLKAILPKFMTEEYQDKLSNKFSGIIDGKGAERAIKSLLKNDENIFIK